MRKGVRHGLFQILARHRSGSFATQADRRAMLVRLYETVDELGFRLDRPESLKPKHVLGAIAAWQAEGLNPRTIKNRLAAVRWLSEIIQKPGLVPNSNAAVGIADTELRQPKIDQAWDLDAAALAKIDDPVVHLALRLIAAFGLRRAEALKFRPALDDKGDHLLIQHGTKGGRPRAVPVVSAAQRKLLAEVRAVAGGGSIIPPERSYKQQLDIFRTVMTASGLQRAHGLRHAWAQQRYRQLTGWPCPGAGGPSAKQLARPAWQQDRIARLTISKELGHNRLKITEVYLGG